MRGGAKENRFHGNIKAGEAGKGILSILLRKQAQETCRQKI